eukprot:2110488-Amphidinium_carterae.1
MLPTRDGRTQEENLSIGAKQWSFRDTDAPFQLGEHQHVVKHASFLQCLDCNRQAGRVKATGKYNFAHMRTQDCRPLKTKKKRPTGFPADTKATSSCGAPPAGEATGGPYHLASE